MKTINYNHDTKNKHLASILMIFLLSSCLSMQKGQETQAENTKTPLASTFSSEGTNEANSQWTLTPNLLSIANLSVNCIEVESRPQKSYSPDFSAVLEKTDERKKIIAWQPQANQSTLIIDDKPEQRTRGYSTSPDGNWIAFVQSDMNDKGVTIQNWLIIMSSDGNIYKKTPIDINLEIANWLNSEQLLLRFGLSPRSKQWVLNPFTNQQIDINLEIPDPYDNLNLSDWGNIIIFSPDLNQAVYAGNPADLVLIDTLNSNIIARISPVPITNSIPKWSPIGEEFIISYADITDPVNEPDDWEFEIYKINKDGKMEKLTNLSSYYKHPNYPSYQWSPDGLFIGLWIETDPQNNPGMFEFATLELNTGIVTNFCLKSSARGIPKFYWSPDSKNIIIESFESSKQKTIWLDLERGDAFYIGEGFSPLGWIRTR